MKYSRNTPKKLTQTMQNYCNSLTKYSRFKTREVIIGNVLLGAQNPIRIQSMTTTDTMDTEATVAQSIRMIESGCGLVRITAPSINEAKNLENIKKELRLLGYDAPLVADIHFTPNAAEIAARIVEKVRVNPGNYADKKKFEEIEYTDAAYQTELLRIKERFTPLVKICIEHKTAMRIGTNHGSLSDRIMSRYGDTPHGMVESAMEFLRICEDNNFHNIVISMKSSNTQVMVQAYRLLVKTMIENNMNYPLHLGVTEAGEGEDGRIKSAVGIGTLLEDGIGDTVRVSLTEDPEFEAPVAIALVNRYANRNSHQTIKEITNEEQEKLNNLYSPYDYKRRETFTTSNFGAHEVPRVIADYSATNDISAASLFAVGLNYNAETDKWNLADQSADYIFAGNNIVKFQTPGTLGIIYNSDAWYTLENPTREFPLFCADEFFNAEKISEKINFIAVDAKTLTENFITKLNAHKNIILVFDTFNEHGMAEQRRMFFDLLLMNCKHPVIIKRNYKDLNENDFQLQSATDAGALFIDGFGDGLWLKTLNCGGRDFINRTAFGILQATRTRISKTEYISCPSCGRTLFDLQETTAKIRKKTDHLKGLKIGIMGCIVNGPGEMADADYGYVGVGVGKITLYKGREVVQKNIAAEGAVDALIDLIKTHGDWVEKE